MSKKGFWNKQPVYQCPHCPKKFKHLRSFAFHLQYRHVGYTWKNAKAMVEKIVEMKGKGVEA